MMIKSGLNCEIARAALGYDLRFKITNELMETYLTPTYLELRQRTRNSAVHSSLSSWLK